MGIRSRVLLTEIGGVCLALLSQCRTYDENASEAYNKPSAQEVTTQSPVVSSQAGSGDVQTPRAGSGTIISAGSHADVTGAAGSGGSSLSSRESCGDGLLSSSEKCDVAIEQSKLGACPRSQSDCPPGDACTLWVFNNKIGCSAECTAFSPPCKGGDGCCPINCNSASDSDCSASCGDGVVQKERGERCEPEQAVITRNPQDFRQICPEKCPDDGDPCTEERIDGSAENCNAECVHTGITALANGDGCCPEGADANYDTDCQPVCGNGVREGSEKCDRTSGCDASCDTDLTPDQQRCIETYGYSGIDPACDTCMCINCQKEVAACYENDKEKIREGCSKAVQCGFDSNCLGSACYCGTATGLAFGTCVFPEMANGPCKSVFEAVSGTTDLATLVTYQSDPTTALGIAQAISDCYLDQCIGACNKK
jgi:hypothetical protein